MLRQLKFLFAVVAAFAVTSANAVTLNVFEWEGYISTFKDDFEAYAKSKGKDIKLNFIKDENGKPKYISTADDIFKELRAKKVDIVTPTHNYYKGERGRYFHLLHPLDTSKMPNYSDVLGSLRSAEFADYKGGKFAVPLLGGSYALAYNAANVEEPTSWKVMADPKNKGRTSITGGQVEANVYVAAIMAGSKPADVYNIDKIDSTKTSDNLKAMATNSKVNWDGMVDPNEMKNLDYVTTYWFGVAAANAEGQNWKFADPKEGQTVWLDNISISKQAGADADKLEAAYMLLDYMISPDVQQQILKNYGSIVVNTKVKDMISAEEVSQYRVGDESFFKKEYFWQPLDSRTRNGYKVMWENATK